MFYLKRQPVFVRPGGKEEEGALPKQPVVLELREETAYCSGEAARQNSTSVDLHLFTKQYHKMPNSTQYTGVGCAGVPLLYLLACSSCSKKLAKAPMHYHAC